MKAIWKFALDIADEQIVSMPTGATLVHVGQQFGELSIWAEVDRDAQKVDRLIVIHGTGHPMGESKSKATYIGTVLMPNTLEWHIYDHGEAPS